MFSNRLGGKYHFNKLILFFLAVSFFSGTSFAKQPKAAKLKLVPYPQKVDIYEDLFEFHKGIILIYDHSNDKIRQVANTFEENLDRMGFLVMHGEAPSIPVHTIIKLQIKNPSFGQEGYQLQVDQQISITAQTPDGLFWATRTLLQLVQGGPGKSMRKLLIIDEPKFSYRGLLVDTARQFHTIDFHIRIIKQMASYKLNRYQIHFSDHESFTLPCDAFPSLPTKGRCYTKEEIKRLVDIANQYHVMLVPEIDVPGHATALIQGIDALRCNDSNGSRKICLGKESTYKTLETIYAEVMDMIPGQYWHLGADEVSYNGTKCPECIAQMKQENLKNGSELYHHFINRIHNFVKSKNRTMLVWEGFSPTGHPTIHKDILVCPFDVKHRGHMPSDYFNAGYNVLNTSWTPLYVADKIYLTTPEIIAKWSPYMFGAGRSPQPYAYWKKFNPKDYHGRIVGGQMCSWANEEKAEEGMLFGTGPGFHDYGRPGPRIQIMAERLWTGSSTTSKDLLERVGASYWQ